MLCESATVLPWALWAGFSAPHNWSCLGGHPQPFARLLGWEEAHWGGCHWLGFRWLLIMQPSHCLCRGRDICTHMQWLQLCGRNKARNAQALRRSLPACL